MTPEGRNNGARGDFIAGQRVRKQVSAAIDTQPNIEELLRTMFLFGPCRGVIESTRRSFKSVEFRDACLPGRELGSRGIERWN
jgi:hypothetical protein